MPRARFRCFDLLHNPANNLQHANQNLIDHLSADIQELPEGGDPRNLVTYRLTEFFALQCARQLAADNPFDLYQFELRLITPMTTPLREAAILTSPALRTDINVS